MLLRVGVRRTNRDGAAIAFLILSVVLSVMAADGCRPDGRRSSAALALVDSVLAELGGTTSSQLERGQRWRMISSIGAGLPPSSLGGDDLPESDSHGAGLLRVYCVQCHWLPAPQMHTAAEWKLLMPRMLLRARTLRDRMGGPLTGGLIGDVVLAGLKNAELPSPEQVDSMLAYLSRNALAAAEPVDLTEGPGRDEFIEQCSMCHALPSPRAHTAAGWDRVINTMEAIMVRMDMEPLSDQQADLISGYLRARVSH